MEHNIQNNTKKLPIIILIIVAVVAIAYFIYQKTKEVPGSPALYTETLGKALGANDPSLCAQAKGYSETTADVSVTYTDEEAKNNCYTNFSISRNNVESCSLVSSPYLQSKCELGVLINLDQVTIAACENIKTNIPSAQDPALDPSFSYCVSYVAEKTNDKKVCNTYLASNEPAKNACISGDYK